MTFLEERDYLYSQALSLDFQEVPDNFKRDFLKFVNNIIIDMLSSEDNFFGAFMIRIEREIRFDITWPLATVPKVSGFLMYFNPLLFLKYDKKEMAALFKHEIYHIMYSHYKREKYLKDKYSSEVVAIALDISINQFIKNMPMEAKRLDSVSRGFDVNLKENQTVEQYAEVLQEAINSRIKKSEKNIKSDSVAREVDISKAHEVWNEAELSDDSTIENMKKIAVSIKSDGAPSEILNIINAYGKKAELNWEETLKHLIPTVKYGYKKTIMRRNRRQPERMDLRGRLANNIPEIILAIDISASMSDEDIHKIMIEILAITQSRKANITVIECDNEVRNVYKLTTHKDIQERSSNSGSTLFSPVFKYARDNNMKNSIIIYFTDGVGEEKLDFIPVNKNIIWVLTSDEELSLRQCYGQIKRLKPRKSTKEQLESPLEEIREVINDWAR